MSSSGGSVGEISGADINDPGIMSGGWFSEFESAPLNIRNRHATYCDNCTDYNNFFNKAPSLLCFNLLLVPFGKIY